MAFNDRSVDLSKPMDQKDVQGIRFEDIETI